ncbi:tRNA 2-selenouridine(34) synthase MnmH [Hyphococcus flavus]|uniref:tRNA 2-selenouridine(34) synthase MnmH n=1 Tax=Hyphococcus flavus TaxID=1866326 RepID=A0AAF0CFV4_9PROT|nr:tRNA 2-selenouridine(34) synthase MnmH [Hyphococcus flavus]WDI31483.1 tRNA 2-selenouridine(34) synthase MnmH [Hyphococcus flavus]
MNIEEIADTGRTTLARFDAIIDVRSPDEFAADHLPAAINLPVLSNQERAEIGAIYKQDSPFRARRLGAAYVARNVAHHLQTALANKPNNFLPLIYCWRGGMRSNAMATILSQVGWRTAVLKGGYKTWRRSVFAALRDDGAPLNIVLLDGQTGTAKSEILRRVASLGVQTIDLEGLANHRGSVFGGFGDDTQPSQKLFESRLWTQLQGLDLSRPILLEAESNRIGQCEVPRRLWSAMRVAPSLALSASPAARAKFLLTAYADITQNETTIMAAISRLAPFHARGRIAEWRELAETRDHQILAKALMRDHYDPLYDRSRNNRGNNEAKAHFHIQDFDDATLDAVAKDVASALTQF